MARPKTLPPLRSGSFVWGPQRVRLGISITALARATGINVGDLSKMENGRLIVRGDEYDRVTAVLFQTAAAQGSTPAG